LTYTNKVDIKSLASFTQGNLSGSSQVLGMGFVLHSIKDTDGMLRTLKLKHYHVPSSRHKIIATSKVLDRYQGESISIHPTGLTLSGITGDPAQKPIFAPRNVSSSLLISIAHRYNGPTKLDPTCDPSLPDVNLSTVSNDNLNLSPADKELLKWHQRLAHTSFSKVQHIM